MQICWWEYAELLEHLQSRKDLWQSDGVLWTRMDPEGTVGFALQFIPPEQTGPYRMYTIHSTPVSWEESDVTAYLEKLMFYWTSYSTRTEFAALLMSELKLDEQTSWLMSIALMRASVEPRENPDRTAPPARVQHLWSDAGEAHYQDFRGVGGDAILPLNHGGYIGLVQHHEQLRISVDIVNPFPANGPHHFRLTGFVKPHGYDIGKFIRLMQTRSQEELMTSDPDAKQEELIYGEDPDTVDPGPDSGVLRVDVVPVPETPEGGE